MSMLGDTEARLLLALAALSSVLFHAFLYLGVADLSPPPDQEVRIEVRQIPARPDAPQEPPKRPVATSAPIHEGPEGMHSTNPSRPSWRRRLQKKEAQHQTKMMERAAKLTVLEKKIAVVPHHKSHPASMPYRCGVESSHRRVIARSERDVSRYAGIFPAGLFPASYVEKMRELSGTRGRGRWSFALPQGTLPIMLDAPEGVLLAAGRDDRRCVVDVDFTPQTFFPLHFLQVPLRIVDEHNEVHSTVVDVDLFGDGTFRLSRLEGDPLPFISGALYDHVTVGRNLQRHYLGARLLRDMAGLLFGEER